MAWLSFIELDKAVVCVIRLTSFLSIIPFRNDLNKIPYDYTVEVKNRFKGLDLIECRMNYGQRFVTYRRQGARPSPRKKMQKSKMAV